MTVQAKLLSHESLPIACHPSNTLDELRARVHYASGVRAKHQRRLVLNGKELAPPEATLADLGVTDGATVTIVVDRDFLADDKAEWQYELSGIQRRTTWGPWTDVLVYPAGSGKHEKGPLGAKFGNLTSQKAYKRDMHGPPGKSGGVYEWRVVLAHEEAASDEVDEAVEEETVGEEDTAGGFGGSFVFYCGKAETTGAGLHQRVRQESLGNQGGNMDAFFYAVLGKIERSRTDARFSVKFQARSTAITNDAIVVNDDRGKDVNQRRGYFPSGKTLVDGGCNEKVAEDNLQGQFDYAACKRNNGTTRLEDFQIWLQKQFARLPRVVSVVRPALEGHVLSGDPEWIEYASLSADAVNTIVEALEKFGMSDCDEVAEVLQLAAAEGYKKACADFKEKSDAAAYPDGGHSSAGFEFPSEFP